MFFFISVTNETIMKSWSEKLQNIKLQAIIPNCQFDRINSRHIVDVNICRWHMKMAKRDKRMLVGIKRALCRCSEQCAFVAKSLAGPVEHWMGFFLSTGLIKIFTRLFRELAFQGRSALLCCNFNNLLRKRHNTPWEQLSKTFPLSLLCALDYVKHDRFDIRSPGLIRCNNWLMQSRTYRQPGIRRYMARDRRRIQINSRCFYRETRRYTLSRFFLILFSAAAIERATISEFSIRLLFKMISPLRRSAFLTVASYECQAMIDLVANL